MTWSPSMATGALVSGGDPVRRLFMVNDDYSTAALDLGMSVSQGRSRLLGSNQHQPVAGGGT